MSNKSYIYRDRYSFINQINIITIKIIKLLLEYSEYFDVFLNSNTIELLEYRSIDYTIDLINK